MAETYLGDPAPYFVAVAHNLYLEYVSKRSRRSEMPDELPQPPAPDPDEEQEYECLDLCMQRLTPANRSLMLEYYRETRQAKIDNRKRLAEELGIGVNAVRIRAHRIRVDLQRCIDKCLSATVADEMN